jgi:hypothetical protein
VDENGLPVPNPMGPISKHKPKVERRINGWLREDEDVRFMAGAMTLIEKTIIFLLRFTGLRVSEAVSLRIRDVNLLTCSRTNADGRISGAEEAPSLRDMAAVSSAACVDERVNRCDRVALQRTRPPAVAAISALPNLPIAEPGEETAVRGHQRVRHC